MKGDASKRLAKKRAKVEENIDEVGIGSDFTPEVMEQAKAEILQIFKKTIHSDISYAHHNKREKIDILIRRNRVNKTLFSGIPEEQRKLIDELQYIRKQIDIYNRQLVRAKKKANKIIKTGEELVTMNDLQELEEEIKNIGKKLEEIIKYYR